MLGPDHPALFMISCEEMPASAAAVDEAPLVEWAVSIAVSTPLSFKTCFNHRAIVEETTGLCGETVAKKSWSLPWSLKPSVAFSYAFNSLGPELRMRNHCVMPKLPRGLAVRYR